MIEDRQNGLLFNPGDSHDLRKKLAWLADHPDKALAMGRFGWQTVETRYGTNDHYEQLLVVYNEVK